MDFGWQSVGYHRSGDFRDMAIGTGYVCVDGETGQCRMLGALESAETDLFWPVSSRSPLWQRWVMEPVAYEVRRRPRSAFGLDTRGIHSHVCVNDA